MLMHAITLVPIFSDPSPYLGGTESICNLFCISSSFRGNYHPVPLRGLMECGTGPHRAINHDRRACWRTASVLYSARRQFLSMSSLESSKPPCGLWVTHFQHAALKRRCIFRRHGPMLSALLRKKRQAERKGPSPKLPGVLEERCVNPALPVLCPLHSLKLINSISTPFCLSMSGRERAEVRLYNQVTTMVIPRCVWKIMPEWCSQHWPLHPTFVLDSSLPCRPRHDYFQCY